MEPTNLSKEFVDFVLNSTKTQNDLRKSNQFCDLILKGKDDVEISVHRVVVSSSCGYIRDMLTSGMKESGANCIVLENINGDILEKIVSFMYLGKITIDKVEDAEEMVKHAPYLQLAELVAFCSSVLMDFLDESSCLKYWRLSETYLIYELRESCVDYILKNSKILLANKVFLSNLTMEEFKELLIHERLPCEPEFVFDCAVEWAKIKTEDTEGFSKLFSSIIDLIQVPLLRKDFILSKILSDEELMGSLEVMKAVLECVKYKWKKDQGILPKFNKSTMPKVGLREKKYLALCDSSVFMVSKDGKLSEDLSVDSSKFQCKEGNSYTTFNNFLFSCGGGNSCGCIYFCPISKEWLAFPDMTIGRQGHSCVAFSDKIYVCGGDLSFRSVEIFNFDKEEWMNGPRMHKSRFSFDLTSVNKCLYAVGGESNFSIEMLDPRTPEGWVFVCDGGPAKEKYCKCFSSGNYIYCFDKDENPVFDTRMNNIVDDREWGFAGKSFDVCNLNDEVGIVSVDVEILRFYKFKLCGEKILETEGELKISSSAGLALVDLCY